MIVVEIDALPSWILERSAGTRRFLFGIAGPPGSGKSTLAAGLAAALGAPVVAMDGFHLPNAVLAERRMLGVKGSPETFAADDFVRLVRELRGAATAVGCPSFDRNVDEPIADQVQVGPDDVVVIVEGNYLLLDETPWVDLSELFDAVAYLDVPDSVRNRRLVDRHIEFGRSRPDAVEFVRRSDAANARRIEASRTRADVLVRPVVL